MLGVCPNLHIHIYGSLDEGREISSSVEQSRQAIYDTFFE